LVLGVGTGKVVDDLVSPNIGKAGKITQFDADMVKLTAEIEAPLIEKSLNTSDKKSSTPSFDKFKKITGEVMNKGNTSSKQKKDLTSTSSSKKDKMNPVKMLPNWMQKTME
jgi:hypothetical protein